MRPVTDSFNAATRGAHQAVFRARVVQPGQVGVDPDGEEIPVLGGDVLFDTGSDINSTLDLTTSIDWPGTAASLGSPYGQECFVERGLVYGTGTKEWVGLGYFRIDAVEQSRAPRGSLRISGSDRMSNVADGRPISPYQFSAGVSVGAIIDFVLGEVVPNLVTVYDWDAYGTFTQLSYILGDDRVKFVRDLLTSYGKVGYFDYAGRFQVKDVPDPNGTPVWDVNAGKDGVLVRLQRTISRDGVYNGVIASGEPVGDLEPVRGVALDLEPTSPTYWEGAFGKVPRFFSSSFITTFDQANNAARSMLIKARGIPYVVQMGSVPNPALEGWDVVRAVMDADLSEVHILDTVKIPLNVTDEMAMTTRKQYLNK